MKSEWIVYDPERTNFTYVTASNQKEAIVKGMEKGYRPQDCNDARPRTGDGSMMGPDEFAEFMDG